VHFEDGPSHPFDLNAQGFSRVNAWWLADAALLAYWDAASARPIWNKAGFTFEFVDVDGSQCHIGYNDTLVIVAFRGTQPDWRDVFDIVRGRLVKWERGGRVHHGFLSAHDRIWPEVTARLNDRLGAALAVLSMDRLDTATGFYTIGSPPVGNRRFATLFNRRHAGKCFRYVNHRDIVVHLPRMLSFLLGRYTHVKARRYINREGTISPARASIADWLSCMASPRKVPAVPTRGSLLPLPGFLVDHTPRRYAVHVWNDYARNGGSLP
jgi:hypothetical protein